MKKFKKGIAIGLAVMFLLSGFTVFATNAPMDNEDPKNIINEATENESIDKPKQITDEETLIVEDIDEPEQNIDGETLIVEDIDEPEQNIDRETLIIEDIDKPEQNIDGETLVVEDIDEPKQNIDEETVVVENIDEPEQNIDRPEDKDTVNQSQTQQINEKVYLYTGQATVYEMIGTDGVVKPMNDAQADYEYLYAGYNDDFYWYENSYYAKGTTVKIKPVAPKLPEGYVAEFKKWNGLDQYKVELLEDNCIALTIEAAEGKRMYLHAIFSIKKADDSSNTDYCFIKVGSLTRNDNLVICTVNGEKVDNLKSGIFPAGTELGIELSNADNYRGFYWYQSVLGGYSIDNVPSELARGIFSDREAVKTTYIVPNQSGISINRFGGGSWYDVPSAGLYIMDGTITEIDHEKLDNPVSSIYEKYGDSNDNIQYFVSVTADEKESTNEFDYIFEKWNSDYAGIEFSNPTEKTTQFTWKTRGIQTFVYATYKKVPKNTLLAEDITVEQPTDSVGVIIEGLEQAGLTDEEKAAAKAGTKINIQISAVELQQKNDENKNLKLIQDAMPKGSKIARILDINIQKQLGNDLTQQITELSNPVKVVINIPDTLVLRDNKTKRNFSVVRLHENEAALLKDVDDSKDTVTIESDRFSYYTLIYQDEFVNSGNTNTIIPESAGNINAERKPNQNRNLSESKSVNTLGNSNTDSKLEANNNLSQETSATKSENTEQNTDGNT